MKCRYLVETRIHQCAASERLLNPTIMELTAFCMGNPGKCPIYQQLESSLHKKGMQAATGDFATLREPVAKAQ